MGRGRAMFVSRWLVRSRQQIFRRCSLQRGRAFCGAPRGNTALSCSASMTQVGRFCSAWESLPAPLPSLHPSEGFGCGITCQCGFDVPRRKSGLPTCPFWPDAACMIQAVSGTRWVETALQPESRRLGPRGQCGPLGSPRLRGPSGPAMRAESMGRQVFMLPLNQLAT